MLGFGAENNEVHYEPNVAHSRFGRNKARVGFCRSSSAKNQPAVLLPLETAELKVDVSHFLLRFESFDSWRMKVKRCEPDS